MRRQSCCLAAVLLACVAGVHAQDYPPPPGGDNNVHYGWADVLRVDPVYDRVAMNASPPREECYEQPVTVQDNSHAGGTLLGAIIGGVLGNTVGKGDGRKAATVAGAVAGGAIGNRVSAANDHPVTTTQTQCRPVAQYRDPRRIVGYDIEYRYRGEVYVSRLPYDPGDRLRVRVSVAPAE